MRLLGNLFLSNRVRSCEEHSGFVGRIETCLTQREPKISPRSVHPNDPSLTLKTCKHPVNRLGRLVTFAITNNPS